SVRQQRRGELGGHHTAVPSAPVSAEQMESARLRAEVAQLRVERDLAKKAAASFALDASQSTPGLKRGRDARRAGRCAGCCQSVKAVFTAGSALGKCPAHPVFQIRSSWYISVPSTAK